MHKQELVDLMKELIGVKPDNGDPFASKVVAVWGSQRTTPQVARHLAVGTAPNCLIFHARGTATTALTLADKKMRLVMLLHVVDMLQPSNKTGEITPFPLFSATWLGLFHCSDELTEYILRELALRDLPLLYIPDFQIVGTGFDKLRLKTDPNKPYADFKKRPLLKKRVRIYDTPAETEPS